MCWVSRLYRKQDVKASSGFILSTHTWRNLFILFFPVNKSLLIHTTWSSARSFRRSPCVSTTMYLFWKLDIQRTKAQRKKSSPGHSEAKPGYEERGGEAEQSPRPWEFNHGGEEVLEVSVRNREEFAIDVHCHKVALDLCLSWRTSSFLRKVLILPCLETTLPFFVCACITLISPDFFRSGFHLRKEILSIASIFVPNTLLH